MDYLEVMQTLEQAGTAQNRKVYSRHGAVEPCYGVSFADLGKLRKRIKVDHALARHLWESGVHDARLLAAMVADPAQMDEALIQAWASDLRNHIVTDEFARLLVRKLDARSWMERWVGDEDELLGRAGWTLLALLAMQEASLPDDSLVPYLQQIETEIHTRKNRTREAMNNALIAIGGRSDALEQLAMQTARRIGKVTIDHGDTSCKTPDAAAYIRKTRQHIANKSADPRAVGSMPKLTARTGRGPRKTER